MNDDFWLDKIPVWCVFLGTIAVVILAIRIGGLIGHRRRRNPDYENEAPLGASIGAIIGLLAFMLAFTFGMAADLRNTRKQLLLDETNAIGTAYLRAGLLREPHRSEVKKLLRDYVDIRANLVKEDLSRLSSKLQDIVSRSEALQYQMWTHAVALAEADRNSVIDALFINSLNQMIDLQNSRITVLKYRVPTPFWNILYLITILSMLSIGYQAGLTGKNSFKVGIILALTFALVIVLIVDLDRPIEGRLRVDQQPLLDLQKSMQTQIQDADLGEKAWMLSNTIYAGDNEK